MGLIKMKFGVNRDIANHYFNFALTPVDLWNTTFYITNNAFLMLFELKEVGKFSIKKKKLGVLKANCCDK